MNKKVLGTALLAGLAIGMGSTAFAAPQTESKDVTYKLDSTYTLRIPLENVTVGWASKQASIEFGTYRRNIEAGKSLQLSMTWTSGDADTLELENTNGTTDIIPTKITKDTAGRNLISSGDILAEYSDSVSTKQVNEYYISFEDPAFEPRAGTYKAQLTFVGEIVPTAPTNP
ncbi:hypothetical protein JZO70_12580 [Enterococcus sp. 669A]|uniref:WxL domain-containing protein n=1 Tax=Candidatus Enterococcus moelleringii TaxID=2815325 RepID=A0ABS3LBJ7_9ENTE|nr:hypothetical protein [Enterococcus sp. 669A]MBO1307004.1 hypothetical protein [Enterococcus sp. 669A]